MPDIILVRVVDRALAAYKKIGAVQHPMNLVYLATYLRERGYIPDIVDLEVEPFSALEEKLKTKKPYLVGITAMTPNIPEAISICTLCRSLGIKTVLGGAHPTALPIDTLGETGCDYVVIGEGEKSLGSLLSCIKKNCSPDNIEGIAFLKDGVAVVDNRPSFTDLEKITVPDRRFLKLNLYKGETTPGILNKAAVIFTSRGCPYSCTFCASKVINQQRVRFWSMDRVLKEIDDVVTLGFKHITVEDDTFTLDSQRVKEFCSYLISKYPRLSWDCDSHVDTLDEKLLTLIRDSNCKKIAFGVESGSRKILKSINKNIDINQVKQIFSLVKQHGILTEAFFMIGYPEETLEDIEATERLIAEIEPDFLFLSIVVPYPGTAIYDYMLKEGFLTHKSWDSFIFFGDKIPWHTRYFSGEELVKIRKRINHKFYLRPAYIFKKTLSVRSLKEFKYLVKGWSVARKVFS